MLGISLQMSVWALLPSSYRMPYLHRQQGVTKDRKIWSAICLVERKYVLIMLNFHTTHSLLRGILPHPERTLDQSRIFLGQVPLGISSTTLGPNEIYRV